METYNLKNRKGMVLPIVMMILMATTIISLGSMAIVSTDIKVSGNYRDSQAAFCSAEAGVERAIASMKYDPGWLDGFEETAMANDASYQLSVTNLGSFKRELYAIGRYGKAVRKIKVVVDVDSVFTTAALNAGGDMILVGKPRISEEGIRVNNTLRLELDAGTPPVNVQIPAVEDVTLISDCYEDPGGGDLIAAMADCDVNVTETPPMNFDSVQLSTSDWQDLASAAPPGHYYDNDGVFGSNDTSITLNDFDCDGIEPDDNGQRTLFVDGDVTFTGELTGICTVISMGKVIGVGSFYTQQGTTVSMISKDDVLLNYDTNQQSKMNGLVYTEGNYELHGKIKFTGIVTAMGTLSVQNPSEFTNNSDPNYWYTYSSAYNIIADPVDIVSWREIFD